MSLDLYIKSKTPVMHRGTGIYVRDNGETRELQTKEEVMGFFPASNPDDINETSYEDHTYFRMNITHNLTEMADECKVSPSQCRGDGGTVSLYELLWHGDDKLGVTAPTLEYLQDVMGAYGRLIADPELFKKFNPSNGWGSYEQLVRSTKQFITALVGVSDNFDDYTLEFSV